MFNINNGDCKIFAKTVEKTALEQIKEMSNSPIGHNSIIRIMPDVHAGKGCVIGTTMTVTDKICPNVLGVDISCGVLLSKAEANFGNMLNELDSVIYENVPHGYSCHVLENRFEQLEEMKCWEYLNHEVKDRAFYSLGTLGGGNHFIEAYSNGFISVHSGSRNIGLSVAKYYQDVAETECLESDIPKTLKYLQGKSMSDYIHDIKILNLFAHKNRIEIIKSIFNGLKIDGEYNYIESVHNYFDEDDRILRKGSVSAKKDEGVLIPLNMRDGMLICKGKGNEDWNFSAPHGAGRLYSRSMARKELSVEEFKKEMCGIYSSCICESTIDESPMAYKDYKEISELTTPTVDVVNIIKPIYNFKSK